MTPEEVVRLVDFRYITDVVTPESALKILKTSQRGKEQRIKEALNNTAVPAYTTSAGWLAFTGDKMKETLRQTIDEGYTTFKFKVGTDINTDRERLLSSA
jgi:L-galactonate dehydratase